MTIEDDLAHAWGSLDRIRILIQQLDRDGRGVFARMRFAQHSRPEPSRDGTPDPTSDWPDGRIPAYYGPGDPTGETALTVWRDKASADLRDAIKLAGQARAAAGRLETICARYVSRPPSAADLRELNRDNTKPEPGCYTCQKAGVFSPVEHAGQCNPCYRLEQVIGRQPFSSEVLHRESTGRWPKDTLKERARAVERLRTEQRAG